MMTQEEIMGKKTPEWRRDYKALARDLLAMLEQLEPHTICGERIGYGHTDDCAWAVLVARAREVLS